MSREARFQYAGAVYHVMAHGDGGKQLFNTKEDHESFLYWLDVPGQFVADVAGSYLPFAHPGRGRAPRALEFLMP